MCGIVGAVAERNITAILLEGLKRLEYRGYDSAGVAVFTNDEKLERMRRPGKVSELENALEAEPLIGRLGIAHTRWATHGAPCERNAHPHFSGDLAVVHNGIIENHEALREQLKALGYVFTSDTDTEVIAHLLNHKLKDLRDLTVALKATVKELHGAYGLAVISADQPDRLVAARSGSPLVIGLGLGENFLASDQLALRQVTDRFMYLEEGDIAEIRRDSVHIWDVNGQTVERESVQYRDGAEAADKGEFRHFMLKEIHEQPAVVQRTLEGRLSPNGVLVQAFGPQAAELFAKVRNVQIVACGTSYHAGMVARYWLEELAGIPCQVEVASEFRYRKVVVQPDTLFVTISQSGETADTLAALRNAKELGFLASLAICNVGISSLVRESDLTLLTQAGREIGVASTKAFTTQLVGLLLLTLSLGQVRGTLAKGVEATLVEELRRLPTRLGEALAMDSTVEKIAELFAEKNHTLFLGRGAQFPVAMEGALKLKEISYIHAEAYPAGELKHGPLALVDNDMPVVTVAPNNELLEKLKSNLQEVRARGGQLIVFADEKAGMTNGEGTHVVHMPHIHDILSPILYTIPLQLLSYYVAVLKGTDVDQPRNLAKSVTVE
ncbi:MULTISPECIES: glutamine--fructose-6-phosphate transaminase (isomerizing) [Pseudomonas]|jgi:glucosamine--fructose-6-phosphate aminotransferase (isomerizing)|uniref:Glutamine--fructose-6-phosphate aminotransferase [isomerizing] n=4 Tax=Pseudomonas fluorescens group TaxID=136843 RepID=A0ABY0VIM9_9PSED|nr:MULTISPECIES: glutamine--fructose-6-phosphate transaminase (isomerizing) [Pseudomonas]MBU0522044.1 glutamine--fructose-6-phosphate transaminase (isomerizing) [Gammaproteobacteria bacterium]MDF9883959.1 glucosamine--fructose-6-phosphate aminotransferase (isomerizing) [Pseudomonas silensiensis]AHZ70545.1 glucosamine--fructose-6-phosphate aminotransferase [Pseudomonas mandelii JR-1]MBU0842428.1 glutamine--fructose-6-phosphate transaminase (isomerizing) [Gammaproteobacteria bacterium]MBU1839156